MKLFYAIRRWWLAVVRPSVARTLALESLLSGHWVNGVENEGSGFFYFTGWKYSQAKDGVVAQWIYSPPKDANDQRRYYVCIPSMERGAYVPGAVFNIGWKCAYRTDSPEVIKAYVDAGFKLILDDVTRLWPEHFAFHNTRIRK